MSETSAWSIMIAAMLTSNILLANFLGMCSFLACSRHLQTALGLGTAVTFVTTSTAIINYGVYYLILVEGAPLCKYDLTHLNFIVFIAVIAAFVQFVEMFVERFSPKLYFALGIFLPLITVNCAILGTSLFMINRAYSFTQTLGFSFGAGVGWMLAIVLIAGLRTRMGYSNVPRPFQGVAIVMVITGIMAMAFMGFAGMVAIQ